MSRNHDLYFVFELCIELGIDDPIAWYNAVPEKTIDWWYAFSLVRADKNNSGSAKMSDPINALRAMNERFGA